MIRHGMLTIGVAVQAETFTNTPVTQQDSQNLASSSSSSSSTTNTASKSAIFLAPFKNGAPQSLRITFAYNKDTNLPEVIINLNEDGEEQYLKLKDTRSIFGDKGISADNSIDITKTLQVYCFDKMDSPSTTQVFEVKPVTPQNSPTDSIHIETKHTSGLKKPHNSQSNEGKAIDFKDKVTKNDIEEERNNSENAKPSTITKVFNVQSHDEVSRIKSNPKEKDHSQKKERENLEKKSPNSPKIESSTSKSSSKSNGRPTRKKPKSKIMPEKEEIVIPQSPSKGIGDRSKIPFINSAATGYMPCEYYRQKWLQENGYTDSDTWNDYSAIQKTAGQKVINKMTAQQKKLEEDAVAQRKRTEFAFQEDLGGLDVSQNIIPIRRKQTRLEPLRTIPKCH